MRHLIIFCFCSVSFLFLPLFNTFSDSLGNEKKCILPDSRLSYLSLNKTILENFFQKLFVDSTAGYVLYGSKPIYLNNIHDEKSTCIGTDWHKTITESEAFLDVWKNMGLEKAPSDYILKTSNTAIDPSSMQNEFLLINRKAFLEAVDKNIILFQHQMGINVTAAALLNKLLDPAENITSLFKGKVSLIGILLGYGPLNSICYERGINIIKPALINTSFSPPYRPDLPAINESDVIKKCTDSKAVPSFGFSSITDEVQYLSQALTPPIHSYGKNSTKIPFSHLHDTEESLNLLEMYEKTQFRIDEALQEENFLENVLKKFNIDLEKSNNKLDSFCDNEENVFSHLVAQSIYEHFSAIDAVYGNETDFECFVLGMRNAKNADFKSTDLLQEYEEVRFFDSCQLQLSAKPQIKNNLESAKVFFKKISTQQGVICIEPLKLYYKVIKKGLGEPLTQRATKITTHYLISDIEGVPLKGSYGLALPQSFELEKLILGIALGVQGMKRGEIRDIFIHPDYAYGLYTEFASGKPFQVRIKLIDMELGSEDSEDIQLPPLIPFDLQHIPRNSIRSKNELENLKKKYLTFCGFRTGLHYKKATHLFTLDEVIHLIEKIHYTGKTNPELNDSYRKIVRLLNYCLYNDLLDEFFSDRRPHRQWCQLKE
jgi:FKBP-type peptidyl-prolyl cis-trans isomerase